MIDFSRALFEKDWNNYANWILPADGKFRINYTDLLEETKTKYVTIRQDPDKAYHVSVGLERHKRLSVLGNRITTLHRQHTQAYFSRDLGGNSGIKAGKLPNVHAIVEKVDSDLLNHPQYNRINFAKSIDEKYGVHKPYHQELLNWAKKKALSQQSSIRSHM